MENVGVAPPPVFGVAGISSKEFLLDETLTLTDEDKHITTHKIYCGTFKIEKPLTIIRSIVADLSDGDENDHIPEYIMLWRMDQYPIYAIRLAFDTTDNGLFLNCTDDEWYEVDVYNKALALAGMERIADVGVLWAPCNKYDDLYKGLLHIAGLDE